MVPEIQVSCILGLLVIFCILYADANTHEFPFGKVKFSLKCLRICKINKTEVKQHILCFESHQSTLTPDSVKSSMLQNTTDPGVGAEVVFQRCALNQVCVHPQTS